MTSPGCNSQNSLNKAACPNTAFASDDCESLSFHTVVEELLGLEEENGAMTQVEVDEVLRLCKTGWSVSVRLPWYF